MKQQLTFSEHLQAHREGRREAHPVLKAKPLNLPTAPEERSQVVREAARRVIERHRNELESLAYK